MKTESSSQPGNVASLNEVVLQKKLKELNGECKRSPFEDDCITLTVENEKQLNRALELLKRNRVTTTYKETRTSLQSGKTDVQIESIASRNINDVISQLRGLEGVSNVNHRRIAIIQGVEIEDVPWFPRCLEDLDESNNNVIMCGDELDADHPGFTDEEYRRRRAYFTEVAMKYKCGDPIPIIDYTEEETNTWSRVYQELASLYPTHACLEQMANMRLLSDNCGFNGSNVPQLQEVSRFLQSRTGFTLRPVAGFLSPRDFLAGLAFRVFNCTQYMRHSSDPFYTPEPDVCHELLGHVPLLADPSFAQFSHELGMASLGASDADIKRLASCYLYTVEFGLCKENGQVRAYGAGLLSCIAELKHALTSPEKILTFDPEVAANTESYITTFQPKYFVSESLEEVKVKMREFANAIKRPFQIEHCAETNTIRINRADDC